MIERTSSDSPSTARSATTRRRVPMRQARVASAAHSLVDVKRAYLIGIGGVGMSGIAELLAARGIDVFGSDRNVAVASRQAAALGLRCDVKPDDEPLPDVDLVVYSSAVPVEHPQRLAARARNVPQWRFAEMLGALMGERTAICVAGCHGKTTTSALISAALLHLDEDPSFLVGGTLSVVGRGARAGAGPVFVAESCEFDRSFHAHRPRIAIVTNVDEDHLDYYADLAEITESFRVFASKLPPDGVLLVNDAHAAAFEDDCRVAARIERYGFDEASTWRVGEPQITPDGTGITFSLDRDRVCLGDIHLPMFGRHNALNATAACAAMMSVGISFDRAAQALSAFGGVGRRLEFVASRNGVLIFDDYGHHPAEIRAVVRALRIRYDRRRLVIVFQPHQASRTRCLMTDFAAVLAEADEVWMPPIYFARDSEEARRSVTSEDLVRHVRNEGGRAIALPDLPAVVAHAKRHLTHGDIVVTMGAGDVDEVARGLAQVL